MVSADELCNLIHEVTNKDLNILVVYFSVIQCGMWELVPSKFTLYKFCRKNTC